MPDTARDIGLMTGSEPGRSAIVVAGPHGRQNRSQEDGTRLRVAQEIVEHNLDLRLRGVRPDRVGKKEIELLSEHTRVEVCIRVEARVSGAFDIGLEDQCSSRLQSFDLRLDSVVTVRIEKVNQPVPRSQNAAAEIEELGLRLQARQEEEDELLPAGSFEPGDRHAEKLRTVEALGALLNI